MWPWWAEEPEAGRRNGAAPGDESPVALAAAGMAGVVAAAAYEMWAGILARPLVDLGLGPLPRAQI